MPRQVCIIDDCNSFENARGLCQKHQRRLELYGDPNLCPQGHASPEERFWRRVNKTDGCWLWTSPPTTAGYGRFQLAGRGAKHVSAHRYSYELAFGPIPEGLVVMHSCDNRICVNPDHLSVGTHKQNTADMIAKGRKSTASPKGEASGKAKLTPDQVRYIRTATVSQAERARVLGICLSTIRSVLTGRTWSHIT